MDYLSNSKNINLGSAGPAGMPVFRLGGTNLRQTWIRWDIRGGVGRGGLLTKWYILRIEPSEDRARR
jgi:hypothetical protein